MSEPKRKSNVQLSALRDEAIGTKMAEEYNVYNQLYGDNNCGVEPLGQYIII